MVATRLPTPPTTLDEHVAELTGSEPELLVRALETAVSNRVPAMSSDVVFTDERAPVETIVDSLVLRYLLQEGAQGLPGIGN